MTASEFFEFGPYRVDLAQCRLLRGDTFVSLPPKAFDLLVLLVRTPNRVLSKNELIQALWPSTYVDEANLTQHVFTLRKALGSRPDGAAYIETVPRRGYLFAATVKECLGRPEARHDASPLPAPAVVEGERKQATVLHCGVANADVLAERCGPARLDAVMTELAAAAERETSRYEGVLRRTRPDAFEAVFGARVVHEDDPWRAVLTAFAVQRAAVGLAASQPTDDDAPVLRIGIATGPLVVTRRVGDRCIDYSAVGEPTRVADLLQQLADPGAILISDTTRPAVEGYVALERTPLQVEGAAAYRVAASEPARLVRPPRLMRTLEPFVGRVHELGLLANLAARARGGHGQVAGVVGEPGIGKSRLLLEFTNAIPDVSVLEARCLSYGGLVPYLPLADLVRAYFGIKEGDDADDVCRTVRTGVAALDLHDTAATRLLRLLGVGDVADGTLSPEAIKAQTFDALSALFLRTSTRQPVVIVVEDIHWIDRTSEEFLTTLVERIAGAHLLLVVTFRPEYQVPWRDRSYVTRMTLTPLAVAEGEALIDAVAWDTCLPAEVSAEILAKAEGNPFFLGELTRAVLERGPGNTAHRVPDTVHGVIMARIDRLPDSAKQLLQTMAVLGREVPLRLLVQVWGTSSISSEVDALSRLEFVYEQAGRDERVLVFKHALTQDVAYDSLLARQRRDLHLAAARALEELYAGRLDEIATTLAYHYVRTDLPDEAVTWLSRAADRAARTYANAEAILHLDLARRRLERLPAGAARDRREVDVALKHAHSLYFLGRWRESVEILVPYNANLVRLNDPALTAAYAFWLAHMYTRLGDQRQAADHAQRAIAAGTRAGDSAIVGKAHGVFALNAHWWGGAPDGIAHGEESVRILSGRRDQRWWLGMSHFYLAMIHLLIGAFDEALLEAAHARAVGEEIGDPRLQTYAGFTSAWVEASRGNCDMALTVCRRSRDQAPDRVSRAYASMILGYALLEAADHGAARASLEPVVAELESFGFQQWQAWSLALIGETYRLDADLDRAGRLVERALDVGMRAQYWYGIGFAQRIAGRIAHDRGRLAESRAAFDCALQTFDRAGARFEADRTRREAAR